MPQKPGPAVPTQREAEATRITSDVAADKQLLGESAGGDSLSGVPLPDVPLHEIPVRKARPDGAVDSK